VLYEVAVRHQPERLSSAPARAQRKPRLLGGRRGLVHPPQTSSDLPLKFEDARCRRDARLRRRHRLRRARGSRQPQCLRIDELFRESRAARASPAASAPLARRKRAPVAAGKATATSSRSLDRAQRGHARRFHLRARERQPREPSKSAMMNSECWYAKTAAASPRRSASSRSRSRPGRGAHRGLGRSSTPAALDIETRPLLCRPAHAGKRMPRVVAIGDEGARRARAGVLAQGRGGHGPCKKTTHSERVRKKPAGWCRAAGLVGRPSDAPDRSATSTETGAAERLGSKTVAQPEKIDNDVLRDYSK